MASFFEKLKKGMDIENISDDDNLEKNLEEDLEENDDENGEEEKEEETDNNDIEEESFEIENPAQPIEKIPPVSFTPKEITVDELEQKLEEANQKSPHIANAAKSSLKSLVKEKDSKKKKKIKKTERKMPKKIKEIAKAVEIKEHPSPDFDNFNNEELAEPFEDKDKDWLEAEGQLVVDVYETEDEIVIQSAIAGVNPEDLDISIENDMVAIKGKREHMLERKEKNYFYSECHWGYFSREIILPKEVDSRYAEATMKNGILTIRMPKLEKEKKRISIK